MITIGEAIYGSGLFKREKTMEKTVTIAFVNPPKGNSKSHTIKTTDGELIGFFADKLTFVKGGTYKVLIEEREYQGKTYQNATRIVEEVKRASTNGTGAGGPSPERWWMPFVSNTVAHALQSGQITDPSMVKLWAAAAKQAAMELDAAPPIGPKAREPNEDEDIPY